MKVDKEVEKLIKPKSEPKIYAFKTPEIMGATKIGETTRGVDVRLSEWSNIYPNLEYVKSWSAKIDDDGNVVYFRDISVHKYLENIKNRKRLQNDIFANKNLHYSNEFFWDQKNEKDFKNLMDDIDDAIKAITDNYKNNNGDGYDYYRADLRELVDIEPTHDKTYQLRDNQKCVVDKFKSAVKKGERNLLMYAVMRFGKSFTAMNCALELKEERRNKPIYIVIVSGYKDVGDEWKKTICEHESFKNMEFISSLKKRRSKDSIIKLLKKGKDVVLFTTLQALNNYNRKDKDNEDILVKPVDLLIVDETHFAARGEKDGRVLRDNEDEEEENYGTIEEAEQTIDKISLKSKDTITMHLSGTPYRILMGDEFNDDQIIAKVGYNDILKSKDDWDEENRINIKTEYPDNDTNVSQSEKMPWNNDYFGFPQMLRFGFNLNESSIKELEELNSDYSLNELFNTKSKVKSNNGSYRTFKHKDCVKDLLMAIDGSEYEDPNVFGMLNYEKIRENDMCKHIVMVLPYRSSCDALEKMLEDNKEKKGFANLSKYDVINVAGFDSKFRGTNVEQDIKNRIASSERTISLTVKKMLVGVTVPQWDTMIYLKNTKSPQEYDQAIYRLQSPYIKKYKDDKGYECQVCEKEQTILVDFDLHRLFELQEQNAEMTLRREPKEEMSLDKIKNNINEDIKYSPIICVNKNKLSKIEPTDIVSNIFDYDSRKSITDLVNEMLIDPLIFKSKKLSKYFENENSIKNKKGLVVSASSSDDDGVDIDMDENNLADEENRQENQTGNQERHTDTEDEKEGKYRSKISKILFYAYFTNDTVCSLKDLIDKSESEENKAILKHIKLEKGFLNDLFKECLSSSSETLVSLDVNISKMNLYSKDKSMETTEKILTRFSRLGDSTVLSPKEVVEKIIYNIQDDDFNDINENNKILDIASTAAEFAPTYVERMMKMGKPEETIKNSIVTIPKDGLCYELAKKVYENLGLNVDNIATFYATELSEMIRSNQTSNEKIVQVLNNAKCPINKIKITDFQAE